MLGICVGWWDSVHEEQIAIYIWENEGQRASLIF